MNYTQIGKTLGCAGTPPAAMSYQNWKTSPTNAGRRPCTFAPWNCSVLMTSTPKPGSRRCRGSETAIDRCLRIMERRSKLLGLDAAEKVEHSGDLVINLRSVDMGVRMSDEVHSPPSTPVPPGLQGESGRRESSSTAGRGRASRPASHRSS